ncbi:hypothetical protein D3C87_241710 [compost metagenome]
MSQKIIEFIQREYDKRSAKNKRYSLRAFASSLDVEHSMLTKILANKRPLTFETANRILAAMNVELATKNSLLLSLSNPANHAEPRSDEMFVTLTEAELASTYQWYFYAILSALEVPSVAPTVEGIAEFLRLDGEITRQAIKTLAKMGAISSFNKKLSLTGKHFTTTNDVKNAALVQAHVDMMNKAIEHLTESNVNSDYTGITTSIPIEKLAEAKRRIKEFRRSLGEWLGQDDMEKTDVYRINIQFFPLAKSQKKRP